MDFRRLVIDWNNRYPLDRWFRKKHNIRFNSSQHRGANLLDIYFEFIEEKIYSDAQKEFMIQSEKDLRYKKNGWLEERHVKFEEIKFTDADLSLFDEHD